MENATLSHGSTIRRWLTLGLLLAHLGTAVSVLADESLVIDPQVRAAVAGGRARVLLELRVPGGFRPEGELPGIAAVEAQRRAIATSQADVLARLSGTKFALARQYEALPMMALEIGADALTRLEAAGNLVAKILPDTRRFRQQ